MEASRSTRAPTSSSPGSSGPSTRTTTATRTTPPGSRCSASPSRSAPSRTARRRRRSRARCGTTRSSSRRPETTGPAGVRFGSISGPGGSRAALTVGAADLRPRLEDVRVVLRSGLRNVLDRRLAAGRRRRARRDRVELELAQPTVPDDAARAGAAAARAGRVLRRQRFQPRRGASRARPGRERRRATPPRRLPAQAPRRSCSTAAELPSGAVGLTEDVDVPVVAVPEAVGPRARARAPGRRPGARLARAQRVSGRTPARAASPLFSSRGLAFDGRLKPDLAAPGVALLTAEPGRNPDASPRFGTASGSSAAAAVVAGTAALLVQARPWLDAVALKGLLVGRGPPARARRADRAGSRASSTSAPRLRPRRPPHPPRSPSRRRVAQGWRATRTVTLRNLSTRTLQAGGRHPAGRARSSWPPRRGG